MYANKARRLGSARLRTAWPSRQGRPALMGELVIHRGGGGCCCSRAVVAKRLKILLLELTALLSLILEPIIISFIVALGLETAIEQYFA